MWRIKAVPKIMNASMLLFTLLFVLSLAACEKPRQGAVKRPIPEISTITVQTAQVMETTELPGRTAAYRVAEIRPQINGVIQKRLFEEGSDVKAGQLLYQIDPAPFQAALDSARAALERSKANLPSVRSRAERYKALLAERAVSQQDYDDAASAYAQIKADILYWQAAMETARINLGYTKVTATISGRIGRSYVSGGAVVTAYQPQALAVIQQLDPIYVDVPQATTQLLRLEKRLANGELNSHSANQKKVKLILDDNSAYPLEGTLQFRDVTVDPSTGSVVLRMVFPNPDGVLLPEMFVRTVVNEGINEKAVMIPQRTVARNQRGEPYVMIVGADNKVSVRMITIDRAVKDQWLVSSGLASGDRVIVEGLQWVRPGAVVKTVAFDPGAASTSPASQQKSESK